VSDIHAGDRVTFTARLFGPADPLEGTPAVLSGTVFRPVWGSAAEESRRNVSIRTDEGPDVRAPGPGREAVMTADDIITAITQAPTEEAALMILADVPRAMLVVVADQLYIDPHGRSSAVVRRAIAQEARS
jgi:hypothetical protein